MQNNLSGAMLIVLKLRNRILQNALPVIRDFITYSLLVRGDKSLTALRESFFQSF